MKYFKVNKITILVAFFLCNCGTTRLNTRFLKSEWKEFSTQIIQNKNEVILISSDGSLNHHATKYEVVSENKKAIFKKSKDKNISILSYNYNENLNDKIKIEFYNLISLEKLSLFNILINNKVSYSTNEEGNVFFADKSVSNKDEIIIKINDNEIKLSNLKQTNDIRIYTCQNFQHSNINEFTLDRDVLFYDDKSMEFKSYAPKKDMEILKKIIIKNDSL